MAEVNDDIIPLLPEPGPVTEQPRSHDGLPANLIIEREGCTECHRKTPVATFADLTPGDHIVMRGQLFCLGRFYDHHAIVTDVRHVNNDTSAEACIEVVDVSSKGKNELMDSACGGFTDTSGSCCCYYGCCPSCCGKRQYPIKKHNLLNKTKDTWSTADLKAQDLYRVDYHSRKNDKDTTKDVALRYSDITDGNGLKYCVMIQNCEHFANACVNGPTTANNCNLQQTTSTQSPRCCERIYLFFRWLILGFFYGLDFYVYVVFVRKDPDFDIFPSDMHDFIEENCYNPGDCLSGLFVTLCYWIVILIFIVLFDIIYILVLCYHVQPLYKSGKICEQCLRMKRLGIITRILALVIVELICVSIEGHLYNLIKGWHIKRYGAIAATIFVSFFGAILTESVSSVLTWIIGVLCSPTCKRACQFTSYFRFRCCARPVGCCIQGIRRRCIRQFM